MPGSLVLLEFSDRDLLYVLEEAADDSGWASAQEVADLIGIEHKRPAQCVGSRFAWLKRFGVLESKADGGTLVWRMNEVGAALLYPKKSLPAPVSKWLGSLDEGDRMRAVELATRDLTGESRSAIHLTRRAWQFNLGGWRDGTLVTRRNGKR